MGKRVQILVLIGLFGITLGGVCQKSKPELVFDDSGAQAFIKLCEAQRPIEMLMRVISHEIHHCYHMLIPTEDYVDNGRYRGILQALYWLEMEGIASMVQYEGTNLDSVIQSLLKQHGEKAEIWFSAYEDANIHLQSLDNAMKDIFEGRAENPYQHAILALRPADFGG